MSVVDLPVLAAVWRRAARRRRNVMTKKTLAPPQVPGMTPKAGYHHGDLRAHLIAALRSLVEPHGPDGFSLAEAARRAGVRAAAPYKPVKDRDESSRGVESEALDRLRAGMEAGAAAHPSGGPAHCLDAVVLRPRPFLPDHRPEEQGRDRPDRRPGPSDGVEPRDHRCGQPGLTRGHIRSVWSPPGAEGRPPRAAAGAYPILGFLP